MFPGKKKGTHITKVNNSHTKVLAVAELNFVIYDRRQAFTTHVAERRMDLATPAAILGHSNLRGMMRYVHPAQERRRAAMHRFGVEEEIREPRSETLDGETVQ